MKGGPAIEAGPFRKGYFAPNTMTNVYKPSDSMSARPRISMLRIAAVLPGLRAIASVAPAVARPCPMAHRPEAMPMPIQIPTVFSPVGSELVVEPPCANTGVAARTSTTNTRNTILFAILVVFLFQINFHRGGGAVPALGRGGL